MPLNDLPLSVGLLRTCDRPVSERPLYNIQYAQRVQMRGEIPTRNSNQWAAIGFGWLEILFPNYKNKIGNYFTILFQF